MLCLNDANTGPLPKVLPPSLEILDTSGGGAYIDGRDHHKFTGGIPPEWGALTNLKELKIARCGLDGAFGSTRSERLNGSLTCNLVCACTGEVPREIIRMKAKGVEVFLYSNAGFTLPSNIGELGGDITKLNLSDCSLTGPRSTRTERLRTCSIFQSNVHVLVCAGPPLHETVKLLSPLTKLEELRLSGNELGGAIPTDVAVFTNLKTLGLSRMGLEGELSTRSERLRI